MLHVEVVCGVIEKDHKILVTKRNLNKKLNAGMWEFPGGKIENGESKIDALKRELKEELALDVEITAHINDVYFEYPDFTINLYAYLCKPLSDYQLLEHIDAKYLTLDELKTFEICGSDNLIKDDIIDLLEKKSGILMPISSLPSDYGIGSLGKNAYKFIDFLKASNQNYWQVLPIGTTSFGDSPYSTLSTYAGGYYYIDLDLLVKDKLLTKEEIKPLKYRNGKINYEHLFNTRLDILKLAYSRFKDNNVENIDYLAFIDENNNWLYDFSLFMAIKTNLHSASFDVWPDDVKHKYNIEKYVTKDDIDFWKFVEYLFFKQWMNLKTYANNLGIKIIGDLPIYVAYDSSDVWANPNIFQLDENLVPKKVAGVPPDYFSKTGQLWGNPLYNWDVLEKSNYKWWIDRIKHTSKLFDVIRLDHFRAFAGYWAVPYGDATAEFGSWQKGPGMKLFNTIKKEVPNAKIIAEDLGTLTEDVYQLLDDTNYPGMKIFQFGLDESLNSEHLPHNYKRNLIAYPGTHDNQTLHGWYQKLPKKQKELLFKYLKSNKNDIINHEIIKTMFKSKAKVVIVPMQDYLLLGDSARINVPSTSKANWCWQMSKNALSNDLKEQIKNLSIYRGNEYED